MRQNLIPIVFIITFFTVVIINASMSLQLERDNFEEAYQPIQDKLDSLKGLYPEAIYVHDLDEFNPVSSNVYIIRGQVDNIQKVQHGFINYTVTGYPIEGQIELMDFRDMAPIYKRGYADQFIVADYIVYRDKRYSGRLLTVVQF